MTVNDKDKIAEEELEKVSGGTASTHPSVLYPVKCDFVGICQRCGKTKSIVHKKRDSDIGICTECYQMMTVQSRINRQ